MFLFFFAFFLKIGCSCKGRRTDAERERGGEVMVCGQTKKNALPRAEENHQRPIHYYCGPICCLSALKPVAIAQKISIVIFSPPPSLSLNLCTTAKRATVQVGRSYTRYKGGTVVPF